MDEKKLVLEVYNAETKNFVGFVKSVSYDNGRFATSTNRRKAKKYSTEYELQHDIDVTIVFALNKGCYLMYR